MCRRAICCVAPTCTYVLYIHLESQWPLFLFERALFWRVQPPKLRTNRFQVDINGLYSYYTIPNVTIKAIPNFVETDSIGCNPTPPEIYPSYRLLPFQPLEIDPGKLLTWTILFLQFTIWNSRPKTRLMRKKTGVIWCNLQESGIHFIPSHPKSYPNLSLIPEAPRILNHQVSSGKIIAKRRARSAFRKDHFMKKPRDAKRRSSMFRRNKQELSMGWWASQKIANHIASVFKLTQKCSQ